MFWKRNSKHNNELDSGDEDKDMSRIPYCSLSWGKGGWSYVYGGGEDCIGQTYFDEG